MGVFKTGSTPQIEFSLTPNGNPTEMSRTTIIIALWRHKLTLNGLRKHDEHRVIVVAPPDLLLSELNVDLLYQVEGPITSHDQNHGALIQKVRELCASMPNVQRRLCAFERVLQHDIAKIREEMGIEGVLPEQFDQLIHRKDIKSVCRRGGLSTLKYCSLGSVQGNHTDEWVECARGHVGAYPMFLRPAGVEQNCMHTLEIVRNPNELRSWIRSRPKSPKEYVEYLVEECLQNGHEFVAMCSNKTGLIGTFATIDPNYTFFLAIRRQVPYAIEFLDANQTRDVFPGLETFALQCMRTLFNRNTSSIVLVKGFYKGHNSISFLNASLELNKSTLASLYLQANHGKSWEALAVENLIESEVASPSSSNGSQNGYSSAATDVTRDPIYCAVINFPHVEGVLLHQSFIPKRKSLHRIAWRVAEGEELLDADGIDDNVVQLYVSSTDRNQMIEDINEIVQNTDITIDKLSIIDKHNVCRRVRIEITRVSSSGNQLIRSCTTAD
ncbi:hypothetical protein M3Y94_00050100 [Aphelenchoides besseyi]|nr:hypothetical protein M3Y94_00050100 [Aphelenchoides besseyi]